MRILFIVPYVPSLIRVRPYNLIKYLTGRGHRVTVLTLWTTEQEREEIEELKKHCHRVQALHLPKWRSLWNCLAALLTPLPLQAVYRWQPALKRYLERELQTLESEQGKADYRPSANRQSSFAICHVEHLRGARYGLWTKDYGLPTVWDSVDCITHLFQQAARDSRSLSGALIIRLELARTRRHEAWLVKQFDRVLVTSPVDKMALEELAGEQGVSLAGGSGECSPQISILPNGVDLDYFTPTDEPRDPQTIVVTGKMSYHANVTAVLHLYHDIMPHIWARCPGAKLYIIGSNPPREVRALANRQPPSAISQQPIVTGYVPDIRPYLRRAAVAVCPVPYGAGIQNKVLEAMACGTPVVATSQACSALQVTAGENILIADEPQDFAQRVLDLLQNEALRERIGRQGRKYVEEHHDWRAIVEQLEGIYREVITTSNHIAATPR